MPGRTSQDEEETRRLMKLSYKDQQHAPGGFDDWGEYTAYVVHAQRREIDRLRECLRENGIEPGDWDDPLGQG